MPPPAAGRNPPAYNGRVDLPPQPGSAAFREMRFAMSLSVGFGILMFAGKAAAYLLTGSAAILSDAAESVVHVAAVSFAAFSLQLSGRPPDRRFSFGYERISFFSAGFEGALIVLAAVTIIYTAVSKWLAGLPLERLGTGALIALAASLINGGLGAYLIRAGRRNRSLILEANGRHVLTDCWTSLGVVVGLGLVLLTGWRPFDPICAIAVALNILWSGGRLVWRSATGLLDYSDPETGLLIRERLDALCLRHGIEYHGVRFRNAGYRVIIHIHLLFRRDSSLGEAHQIATAIEEDLAGSLDFPAEVVTHLESLEDHGQVHRAEHYTGLP
jgi:cation diffusion facilitator family transporter